VGVNTDLTFNRHGDGGNYDNEDNDFHVDEEFSF
jgi:hypothetical protein